MTPPASAASLTPAQPRRRRKDARPAELLAAALEVFSVHGYAAARMEDIARGAGVSKGTVFLYYESKEALFRAVIEAAVLPHLDAGEALLRDDAPADRLMRELFEGTQRVLLDPLLSAIPRLVDAEAGNFPEVAAYYHEHVTRRVHALFGAVYARGLREGCFRAADVGVLCQLALAPLLYAGNWRRLPGVWEEACFDPETYCRTHVDMFMRGLSCAPEKQG
ncbi:MAG: TetR/AcrR family transcriptional regulator [Candidatus Dactylopiibacterium sp.]|nr:TetR/AcrR family transcriptional regulator [Candidatus Dactylopiibacterium sp.]